MQRSKKLISLATGVALALALSACAGSSPESVTAVDSSGSWDELITAAKAEGSVTLYLSKDDAIAKEVLAKFEEKYGIRGEFLRSPIRDIMTSVDGQLAANSLDVDVVWSTTPSYMEGLSADGHTFLPWGPNAEEFPAEAVTADGVVQLSSDPNVLIYNTDIVKGNVDDYVDVVGKGYRAAMGSTDSTFRVAMYEKLIDLLGEDYFEKIAKDGAITAATPVSLVQSVASGEAAWVLSFPWMAAPLKEQGAPIDWVTPSSGTWGQNQYGISLKGNHPNAGQLLLDYMMSAEAQEIMNPSGGVSVLPKVNGGSTPPEDMGQDDVTKEESAEISEWFKTTFKFEG